MKRHNLIVKEHKLDLDYLDFNKDFINISTEEIRYKKLGEGDHITQTYNLNWNKKLTNLEQEMNVSLTWLKSDLSTQ